VKQAKTNRGAMGSAMTLTVEATYEDGVLKPVQPLPLQEHQMVKITIQTNSRAEQTAGLLRWTGDPDVLRQIAEGDDFGVLGSP
jgi:predicted DNA-binding antitoxin AbrB/MazE fold protein